MYKMLESSSNYVLSSWILWKYHIDEIDDSYENDLGENINVKKTAEKTPAKPDADDDGNTGCTIRIRTCYYSNVLSYYFLRIRWFAFD